MVAHLVPYRLGERYGPFRLALHSASRPQGPGVGPGAIPGIARPRWLRGILLLPCARPARFGGGRQNLPDRNRAIDRPLSALFRGARAFRDRALRHEREG